jgi:ParB-like chromosome segregation protein Spo0J
MNKIKELILNDFESLDLDAKVTYLNELRLFLHDNSPFRNEPVDYVKWEKSDNVVANDYNPNKVAPPEMELLEVSIINDGYTQPIVTWANPEKEKTEVIDGFHRNRVGKESKIVSKRINGYLPIVDIRKEQSNKNDRIASTIRHNRARGKHQVSAMSDIVIELKNRNWSNSRISKQLGMDEEEVLRLCQISGLEHLFSDKDFSNAWISSDSEHQYEPISNEVTIEEMNMYRIPNEKDGSRIFHTFDKWECHKSGFYKTKHPEMSHEECENKYIEVLTNEDLFSSILEKVINEWIYSCEHYLSNKSMNRIAWLGQAAVCYHFNVPSRYSSAWEKLSNNQKERANKVAHRYLNIWMTKNNRELIDYEEIMSINRQVELY